MTRLSTITVPGSVVTANNTQTLSNKTLANVELQGTVAANGSVGTDGQILTSNGTGAYWSTAGAAANGVIWINSTNINTSYVMSPDNNGLSVGPVTITGNSSVTLTSGSRWIVL